ncbi:MAG: bestrophin family ion channel [Nostoc sp.]
MGKSIKRATRLKLAIDLRSSILRTIWWRVIATMIFALIIAIAYHKGFIVNLPHEASLIPGVILGLLLVFRTNTAYERFWEACKIWHDLLNASRILCRNIWTIILVNDPEDLSIKIFSLKLVGILIIAIKLHLRNENLDYTIEQALTKEQYLELKQAHNRPIKIINWFAEYFGHLYHIQKLMPYLLFVELNRSLDKITMLFSGCELILQTPLPRLYSIYLKYLLLLYCFALSFEVVQQLDWFTIPTVGIISFALLGIEDIGMKLENPFIYELKELPLDSFCQKLQDEIEIEWISCEQNQFSSKINFKEE